MKHSQSLPASLLSLTFVPLLILLAPLSVSSQTLRESRQKRVGAGKARPAPTWSLDLTGSHPVAVTLKADHIPVAEIAAALGKKLNVPITLSPLLKEHRVTLELTSQSLELALPTLAPQVILDYASPGGGAPSPQYLAIHLLGYNETPPEPTVHSKISSHMIEGITDEDAPADHPEASEDRAPLRVSWRNNRLSVRARQQPLVVVLGEIASQMKIIGEIKEPVRTTVDLAMTDLPVTEAIAQMPPQARFYLRRNLTTGEQRLWRIVLMTEPRQ